MTEQEAETIPVDPERPDAVPLVEDDESPAHPGEAPEVIEGDDDDEGDGQGDEGDEGDPVEDPSQGRALTEKEIDVRSQKLEKENVRHATRVSDIMADDAPNLIPCPVCMDGIAGWVFLPEVAQLPPEAITRIRQLIGLPDLTTYDQAKFATQCPDCHGMGEVKTGSLVNGYEVTTCETCQKQGWVRTQAYRQNGSADTNVPPIVTGPTVAGPEQPDPEIAHLRERGFTVIPPMQPVNP